MDDCTEVRAIVWTEGRTDWQHLKRAFGTLRVGSRIAFHESHTDFGDDQLLKQCAALARLPQPCPTIFIFDRDNDQIIGKVEDPGKPYRKWDNNVYSFAIPVPPHRENDSAICIELYYPDEVLRTEDASGRRLFLSNEFNPLSGRHLQNPALSLGNKGKLPSGKCTSLRIIDSEVFDEASCNVALSKADFARNVTESTGQFTILNFEAFKAILAVIDKITEDACIGNDLPFADVEPFFRTLDALDKPHQLAALAGAAIRTSKLGAMVFAAATFRHYEQRILDSTGADAKKIRPIRQLLDEAFGSPSLSTIQKFAQYCYHLIDDRAPSTLCTLRAALAATPVLGALGEMLEQLERLLPSGRPQARALSRGEIKKPVLEFVLRELARYDGRTTQLLDYDLANPLLASADVATWCAALSMLLRHFNPLRHLTYRVRSIERARGGTNEFLVRSTTYHAGREESEQLTQTYEDLGDGRLESSELLADDATFLDLSPFVVIKAGSLQYYNRTTSRGYEYLPTFASVGHLELTKRKFSHVALRCFAAADLQGLFWTQVTPSVNTAGVKTNTPTHSPIVGRKQQLAIIMDEIIQIPNQNGIVYGPGGVGKTALLIELSRQLSDQTISDGAHFKNIIWVSAKRDYYIPELAVRELRTPQFRSLDNVLEAILEFHGFEDASGYPLTDKRWLVIESLRDETSLIILDNFETVPRAEQEEIVRYFGVEVKQRLKDKPDFCKVLVTSRELIPSGFHQIKLKGLDKRESKELMRLLYEPYAHSQHSQLTEDQLDALYDATRGIPLLIKHCYGQIFEYGKSVEAVLRGLSSAGNDVVDFSFAEIFKLLKQDELELRTILLLELSGRPLMRRQIADMLGLSEAVIESRLAPLGNFQCVVRSSTGLEEKYGISEEVHFFTRRLTQEYDELAAEVKRQIANLPLEKRLDYSQEEADVILMFEEYVRQGHHVVAEDFIKERLAAQPGSLLLNLHYAKYLKEIKQLTEEAIGRLEGIRQRSGNDPQVLKLLMTYYVALPVPRFEQAHSYAKELEECAAADEAMRLELARFYVAWSTALKLRLEIDPNKEMLRQQAYKELADAAIKLLKGVGEQGHEWQYLMAQSCYNRWDYESALRYVDKAVEKLPKPSHLYVPYVRFRGEILKKREIFARRKSA